ncbi:MAG: tol-pal system protein YbgF [Elusimicrobia bacterium HGW-Elusimicrobia-1]|jgi:tol-pal system protein YbgF|nr:MAG: tol-pal system protein YbgF [Elusimicrobia bacterium HGW-Elusimicrobia-1]
MKLIPAAALAVFFPFVFAGCLATSREIVELRDDINQLRLKLNELQINQADLGDKMSSLDLNISAFSERLEENKNVMSLVARRLDDMESNITSKVGKISDRMDAQSDRGTPSNSSGDAAAAGIQPASGAAEIPPGELYRMAYDDFVAGRQESAADAFKIFLAKHPDASLAPDARYYLGESYYSRSMWKDASAEFSALVEKYPKSEHTPSALYKKALSEEMLGNSEDAKKIYADIIKTHPASQEAVSAAERLGALSEPSKKK